jgi:hypothetical protein
LVTRRLADRLLHASCTTHPRAGPEEGLGFPEWRVNDLVTGNQATIEKADESLSQFVGWINEELLFFSSEKMANSHGIAELKLREQTWKFVSLPPGKRFDVQSHSGRKKLLMFRDAPNTPADANGIDRPFWAQLVEFDLNNVNAVDVLYDNEVTNALNGCPYQSDNGTWLYYPVVNTIPPGEGENCGTSPSG